MSFAPFCVVKGALSHFREYAGVFTVEDFTQRLFGKIFADRGYISQREFGIITSCNKPAFIDDVNIE